MFKDVRTMGSMVPGTAPENVFLMSTRVAPRKDHLMYFSDHKTHLGFSGGK